MISQRGIDLIKEFEGCVLTAYKDPVGVWTIAYGHTKGVYAGQTVTQEEAEEMLREDVQIYNDAVMKYDSIYHFNQNQEDALTSFAYNIGSIDQLTKEGSRSIEEISRCILLYNKAGGKVLEGLVRRRQAEKALFDEPVEAREDAQEPNTGETTPDNTEAKDEALEGVGDVFGHYEEGGTYTVDVNTALNVRSGPSVRYSTVGYNNLTADGKKHANAWGALLPGTRVTCLQLATDENNNLWMQIPSGWICVTNGDRIYVK